MPLPPEASAEHQGWLVLASLNKLQQSLLLKLLRQLGSPQGILAASLSQLSELTAEQKHQLSSRHQDERLLRWLEHPNHHLVCFSDDDYPSDLLDINSAPPYFFAVGKRSLLGLPKLAIVGSRNATRQGLKDAESFAASLADAGLCVVSGLALGIDAAAHRGALRAKASTIAVLGHGLDMLYPRANLKLAEDIAHSGLLLSEFGFGSPPKAEHFPRRNRLISGLSLGVVVMEAALGSGSLITARMAASQNREVFALPGSIHSPVSRGCHRLIKEGAKLVETVEDILTELRWWQHLEAQPLPSPTAEASSPITNQRFAAVLSALGYAPCSLDELLTRLDMPTETLLALLLEMELEGHIASLPGDHYQALH